MVAATQEQAAATSEPLVPMTKEKKPVSTARMLHSEIVEGILLDKKAARAHMFELLRARNIIAEVTDVNPLAHDRYFLFQGKCLWCKDAAQAVVYKGTYCRQAVEVPPKTFTLTSVHEHNHADDAPADTARTFEPLMEQAAKRYVAEHTELSAKGLTNWLLAAGFAQECLPHSERRLRLLQNHKPKAGPKSGVAVPPREEVLKRSLQEWPEEESDRTTEVFLVNTLTRKQGCMAHGWVVLTCSVLVKDKLRRTSLGRSGGRGAGQCVHYPRAALTASHDQR